MTSYDAILVVGFGGPEKPDDVMPFLENVTRGRNIPRERLLEVAEHYHHFGGASPINAQVRELIAALKPVLATKGIDVPIYWGNRNWHPMLTDTMHELTEAGIKRPLALVLAAYSSYSSCRQYLENIEAARQAVGPQAPPVAKVRSFFNDLGFVSANANNLRKAIYALSTPMRDACHVAFTAHSIPQRMADGCEYVQQLHETARLVADRIGLPAHRWKLVYQSRSGRPQDPWLEPDICDHLTNLHEQGVRAAVIAPIGFLSDHVEVLYDLDDEAKKRAAELKMELQRSKTVGTHPEFVEGLASLIESRFNGEPRLACGVLPTLPDECPSNCCPSGMPSHVGIATPGRPAS